MACRFLPLLMLALLLFGGRASAQVRVEGKSGIVHLEVNDASLEEVLAALRDRYNLSYRSNDTLAVRRTGVFNGPLLRVAARVLEGYDYVMTITPQGIDVLIMRQAGTGAPAVAARPPLTTAEANNVKPEKPDRIR
ncbi:hypothetical protein JQ615_10075 [Bradyrhizobium jicamae]|uniref:Secretin/TonB short N-terminal domain-containing protein n=1 Tax=Bradyrhizobium jicamae TaxID=280332 RepID=A0ABS5FG28_9BRAD|nr:hypothetical protein [Bradyrhizobium jicamae]MBR0795735.1 hypothetical protein [Bradyrhizobium jicamae]MBR0933758.1 hypothetical protein [Bradyrhizobium jicamae]